MLCAHPGARPTFHASTALQSVSYDLAQGACTFANPERQDQFVRTSALNPPLRQRFNAEVKFGPDNPSIIAV